MAIISNDEEKKPSRKNTNAVSKQTEYDRGFENNIRPKTFDEYIGQTHLKETLKITILAAKKREQPLDHLLFYGPPGLGKTTLASVIANEMKSNIKITSAPALERPRDIIGILMSLKDGDVLFIDEIHRLNKIAEEILYSAMEDFFIDMTTGKTQTSKSIRIPTAKFTLIGATTVGGGVIYEDKYLYSNHSSDPYLGRCHNAYDAVRLYKFGEGKQGEAAMASLCESLGIRADSGKVHRLTIDGMDDEEAKAILNERLEVDSKGNLEKTLKNAQLILKYDPELRDIFAYDLFSEMPVLKRTPSWRTFDIRTENEDCRNIQTYDEMTDTDESYLRLYFEDKYGFDARAVLTDALNIVEHENAFHPVREFAANLTNWNIFFTLFLSLLAMVGLKERKWWLFALALFTVSWWNFDYSGTGIQLMLIFYLCRNHPGIGAGLYALSYLPALWSGWPEDPLCLTVGGLCIDWTIFALLALPLIFCRTHSGVKVNRWFFYAFYPVHLAVIALIQNIM